MQDCPRIAVLVGPRAGLRWLKALALEGLASRRPLRFVVFSDEPADEALLRTGVVTFADRPELDLATDTFAAFGCSLTLVAFGPELRPGALLSLSALAPGPCFVDREDAVGLLSRASGDVATILLGQSRSLHDRLWEACAFPSAETPTVASQRALYETAILEDLAVS